MALPRAANGAPKVKVSAAFPAPRGSAAFLAVAERSPAFTQFDSAFKP